MEHGLPGDTRSRPAQSRPIKCGELAAKLEIEVNCRYSLPDICPAASAGTFGPTIRLRRSTQPAPLDQAWSATVRQGGKRDRGELEHGFSLDNDPSRISSSIRSMPRGSCVRTRRLTRLPFPKTSHLIDPWHLQVRITVTQAAATSSIRG